MTSTPDTFSSGCWSTGIPRPLSMTWMEPSLKWVTSMRVGEAGNGLVHGIVDDLLGQVVRPGGVGVHAGSPLDRIEAPQHLEVGGIVMIRTVFHFLTCLINILMYQTHWKLLIVLHFIRNEMKMPAGLHPVFQA